MSKRPTLTPDERPEWDALILDIVNGDLSSTDVTAKTHKLIEHLADAEQAQRQWADRVMQEAAFHGMRQFLKTWLKENDVAAYKAHDGTVSSMSVRAGIVRDGVAQQVLFVELTREELRGHIAMMVTQRTGLNEHIDAERRLLKIMDKHPSAVTVGEALELEQLTLDDVLGRAA